MALYVVLYCRTAGMITYYAVKTIKVYEVNAYREDCACVSHL